MRAVAAVLILAGGGPALAQQTDTLRVEAPRERTICRRVAQVGTRAGARVACRTESEWRNSRDGQPVDERVAEDSEMLGAMSQRTTTGDFGGNSEIDTRAGRPRPGPR